MSLSFITGAAGAGKSTVGRELAERGYLAYDTDDPNRTGIAGWHSLKTGAYVAGFNELEVTPELLETHIWRLTDDALPRFIEEAHDKPVYLCGRLREASAVVAAAKHLVYLSVQPETIDRQLTQRAQIPGEVTWGQERWQIDKSIEINRELETEYRGLGAIMINGDQAPYQVANDIIIATIE